MAVAGEADEDICTDAVAVDDHLEPTERGHGAEVCEFAGGFVCFSDQAACLAQCWVSYAEVAVSPPWESGLGTRCPSPHDGEDVSCVVEVELVVVDLAD